MTKQTSKKASVKRQENSENSQSSLRQVPSEEPEIVAQDGLATEHLIEHSPPETKRPRTGEDSESRESPIIVTDPAPPVEDRPLSPNSKQRIQGDLAKLAAKIDKTEKELEKLNLEKAKCEEEVANATDEKSREYHRMKELLVLKREASLQEEKTCLLTQEADLKKQLAAKEESSNQIAEPVNLPGIPPFVTIDPLPGTIPSLSHLSHPFCEQYTAEQAIQAYTSVPEVLEAVAPVMEVVLPRLFLEVAGISNPDRKHDLVLYMRYRCFWEMKFIKHDVIQQGAAGFIQGHPGTGKSTTALITVAALCRDAGWDVLWLHAHYVTDCTLLRVKCLHMKAGGCVDKCELSDEMQLTHFIATFRQATKTLLVLDGIRQESGNQQTMFKAGLRWFLGDETNRRYLCISSHGFRTKQSDQDRPQNKIRVFKQWSWTLPEYRKALESKRFAESVEDVLDAPLIPGEEPDKLLAKYYYAGGCARYMFSFKTEEIKNSIEDAIDDIKKNHGTPSGPSIFELSSRLFQFHSYGRTDIISEYASKRIQVTLGSEWLRKLADTDDLSDGGRGSLFQAWVVRKIEEGTIRHALKHNDKPVEWFTSQKVLRERFDALSVCDSLENTLIESTNKREPSIDALFFRKQNGRGKSKSRIALYLFQITTASTHKLDMKACAALAKRFQANTVHIYFIIPSGGSGFKVEPLLNTEAAKNIAWTPDTTTIKKKLESSVLTVDGWIST